MTSATTAGAGTGGMPAWEVLAVVDRLQRSGAVHQVNGGWAADALAGRQTRPHRDLDVFVDAEHCPELVTWLQGRGYVVTTDWSPTRVELTGPNGIVDVHPMRIEPDGDGVQVLLDGTELRHPAAERTLGWVAGRQVVVPTAERQRRLHEGYPARPEDRHDLALLEALDRGTPAAGGTGGSGAADAVPSRRAAWTAVGVGLAVTALTVGGLAVLLLAAPGLRTPETFTLVGAAGMAAHGALMILALWWVLRRDGITLQQLGFHRPTLRLLHLLWQWPAMMTAVALTQVAAVSLLGDLPSNTEPSDYPGLLASPVAVVLTVLATCVLAPVWEEVAFRGILLARLRQRFTGRAWGTAAAVVISALVFALFHAFPPIIPYITTLGICLALARVFHRTLWAPVLLHAANNTVATLGLLAALSQ